MMELDYSIDEIDTIGRARGNTLNNSNNEREQTLNQLLSEMDGFYENKNILVIGATNQLEILDRIRNSTKFHLLSFDDKDHECCVV